MLLVVASHAAVQYSGSGATDAHMRGVSASLVGEATLPLVKWCNRGRDCLVPREKAPRSLQGKAVKASLVPAIAGVCLRPVPLHVVCPVLWVIGAMAPFLIIYNVSSAWWLSLCEHLMLPDVVCVAASLNRVTLNERLRSYRTPFVGLAWFGMFAS